MVDIILDFLDRLDVGFENFLKRHPKLKFWFDFFSYIESGTWAFILLFVFCIICIIVSCFVKLISDNFLLNVLYVMFHAFVLIFCILLGLGFVIVFSCLLIDCVEDIADSYFTALNDYKKSKQLDDKDNEID